MKLTGMLRSIVRAGFAATGLASALAAQDFNVDLSINGIATPPGYAAAGSPGVWNAAAPSFGGAPVPLVDSGGNATPASMSLLSATAISTLSDPTITGDDATLLLDGFLTTDVVQVLRVQGLAAGVYDVIVYGIVPGFPMGLTTFIMPPGIDHVGGAYPGTFVLNVTHGRVQAVVDASGILRIDWVSGFFGGFGFFSGFQLQQCSTPAGNYCEPGGQFQGVAGTASISTPGGLIQSISSGSITLRATNLIDQPGQFIGASAPGAMPFANYELCVDPASLQRLLPIETPSGGTVMTTIDFATGAQTPTGSTAVNVMAGATHYFQRWNREPGVGAGSNLSNAIGVCMIP